MPNAEYKNKLAEATKLMSNDVRDAPYVACYRALKCDGIWTNDADYAGKEGIKVFSTGDLLKLLQEARQRLEIAPSLQFSARQLVSLA